MNYQVEPAKSSTQEFVTLGYGVRRDPVTDDQPRRNSRRARGVGVGAAVLLVTTALSAAAFTALDGFSTDRTRGNTPVLGYRNAPQVQQHDRTTAVLCIEASGRITCFREPDELVPAVDGGDRMGVAFPDRDPDMRVGFPNVDPSMATDLQPDSLAAAAG